MQDPTIAAFINNVVKLKAGGDNRITEVFVAKQVNKAISGKQHILSAFQTDWLANLARQVKRQRLSSQAADDELTLNEQPAAAEDRQHTFAAAAGVSQQQPALPGPTSMGSSV